MQDFSPETLTGTQFTVEYDGPAVSDGLMDVTDLAPSIMALARLCHQVNTVINLDRAKVSVLVRAEPRRGSFGLDLQIVQTAIDAGQALVSNPEVAKAEHILKVVGVSGGAIFAAVKGPIEAVKTVLDMARALKGRKVRGSAAMADDRVEIELADGLKLIVTKEVWDSWLSPGVVDDVRRFLDPLRRPGFDEIRFRRRGQITERITRSDSDSVSEPDGDVLSRDDSTRLWEIRTITFDPTLQWKFFEGRGTRINAYMRDSRFVQRLIDRTETTIPGDLLKVLVRTATSLNKNRKVVVENEILEVLEVVKLRQALPLTGGPAVVRDGE